MQLKNQGTSETAVIGMEIFWKVSGAS